MEVLAFFTFWGLLSWGVAALAESRGRSLPGFFLLSFFFSPILGLIVVLVMPNLVAKAEEDAERDRQRREEHVQRLEEMRVLGAVATQTEATIAASLADELTKLAALRDKGILTDEEFQAQKSALLSPKQPSSTPRPWH